MFKFDPASSKNILKNFSVCHQVFYVYHHPKYWELRLLSSPDIVWMYIIWTAVELDPLKPSPNTKSVELGLLIAAGFSWSLFRGVTRQLIRSLSLAPTPSGSTASRSGATEIPPTLYCMSVGYGDGDWFYRPLFSAFLIALEIMLLEIVRKIRK